MNNVNAKTRFTLSRVFTSALFSILALFILLSLLSYFRFLSFESVLSKSSEVELPNVVLSSRLYGEVASLTTSAELLSKATSNASQRVAEQAISINIEEIRTLSSLQIKDESLNMQLEVIQLELAEFSVLIKQKLQNEKKLQSKISVLYQLHDGVLKMPMNLEVNSQQEILWRMHFAAFIASTAQALGESNLQRVRQIFKKQEVELLLLQEQLKLLSAERMQRARYFTAELEQIFNADDGLLAEKVTQLRLAGRTVGRANFVRNLIGDYAGLIEFTANEIDNSVLADAKFATEEVKRQTRIVGWVLLIAILTVACIIFLIQKQVVRRLVTLNLLVHDKLDGVERNRKLEGNDEISDIANTFKIFAKTIEEQKKTLEHLSMSDGLTGIANRRAMDDKLLHEVQLSVRQKWPVSILLLDVDYFKAFNDNYGHSAGDKCLQNVAKTISQSMHRKSDFAARYGGEEFVCILPDTDDEGARLIAQQILAALSLRNIPHNYSPAAPFVSLSIGIATSLPEQLCSPEMLLKNADKALYMAKDQSRNKEVSYLEVLLPSSNK